MEILITILVFISSFSGIEGQYVSVTNDKTIEQAIRPDGTNVSIVVIDLDTFSTGQPQ